MGQMYVLISSPFLHITWNNNKLSKGIISQGQTEGERSPQRQNFRGWKADESVAPDWADHGTLRSKTAIWKVKKYCEFVVKNSHKAPDIFESGGEKQLKC